MLQYNDNGETRQVWHQKACIESLAFTMMLRQSKWLSTKVTVNISLLFG